MLLNCHSSTGVSDVHFLEPTENDYLLASAGNDCSVKVWKFPLLSPLPKKQKQKIPSVSLVDDVEIKNMMHQELQLDSKLNFVTSYRKDNQTLILCADQTPFVKCYSFCGLT